MPGPALPDVEYERFTKPPLKAMLGQVRFPPILKASDRATLGGYQDAIRSDFPEVREEQALQLIFGPGAQPVGQSATNFRFSTEDGSWSAVLAPDALTLEAAIGEYTSYDQFTRLFRTAWEAAVEHLGPARVVQQGLRYIDHIEGDRPGPEWSTYINPELLGPAAGGPLSEGLLQTITEMRFDRPDGLLTFRHGIAPAGPENKIGYVMDFDYTTQEALESTDAGDIIERFDGFHDVLYRFFRWCVTDTAMSQFRDGDS